MAVLIDKGDQKRYPPGSALRCHLRRGQPARSLPPAQQPADSRGGTAGAPPGLSSVLAPPCSRGSEGGTRRAGCGGARPPGTAPPATPGKGAERRGAARPPQPRFVVITMHTTNFPRISHFPKIKPEDSCECNRSLQNALAKRSIKVDISLDLFLFYFLIIDSILLACFFFFSWRRVSRRVTTPRRLELENVKILMRKAKRIGCKKQPLRSGGKPGRHRGRHRGRYRGRAGGCPGSRPLGHFLQLLRAKRSMSPCIFLIPSLPAGNTTSDNDANMGKRVCG